MSHYNEHIKITNNFNNLKLTEETSKTMAEVADVTKVGLNQVEAIAGIMSEIKLGAENVTKTVAELNTELQ